MKQKKFTGVVWIVILALIAGIAYVATLDLTPAQQHIEQDLQKL